jgi:SHS2 domain-containing protein
MLSMTHCILLDHTADLAIRVEGSSVEDLFRNAAMALMRILVSGDSSSEPLSTGISVSGQDLTDLMVRWLGEILYLFAGDERVVTGVTIRHVGPEKLEATVSSVPLDPRGHEIHTEVKGVTYHKAEVVEQPSGEWTAVVILDV